MSWIEKLSQSKPMALPFDKPEKYDWEGHEEQGVRVIDHYMEPETADREKREIEPQYFGSGQSGVAVLLKDGKVAKYTTVLEEAAVAKHQMEHELPCLVKVYDVQQIQSGFSNVFRIIQERVKPLTWPEKLMADALRSFTAEPERYYIKRQELEEVYKEKPSQMRFLLEHDKFVECIKSHHITTEDAHMYNIGWNNEGRLVLFDMGGSSFR
jgi:hypothetical protein